MSNTITLTKEERDELISNLNQRILFEIPELQQQAADKRQHVRFAELEKMLKLNESILNKLFKD